MTEDELDDLALRLRDAERRGRNGVIAAIRRAFADYWWTNEGDEAAERLAKLLRVRKYSDGSGYNFVRYRTPERRSKR